jgi:hypothetical protein
MCLCVHVCASSACTGSGKCLLRLGRLAIAGACGVHWTPGPSASLNTGDAVLGRHSYLLHDECHAQRVLAYCSLYEGLAGAAPVDQRVNAKRNVIILVSPPIKIGR